MEKSVDDTPAADFVGGAGFSDDGWTSADGEIASAAATVGGEDWEAERSWSTDDGDVGELPSVNFLVVEVVVAAESSTESQQTVDCIFEHVRHFSADEENVNAIQQQLCRVCFTYRVNWMRSSVLGRE